MADVDDLAEASGADDLAHGAEVVAVPELVADPDVGAEAVGGAGEADALLRAGGDGLLCEHLVSGLHGGHRGGIVGGVVGGVEEGRG